ncbi:MAG: Gfo/Idh/MocA family oxidoreductase [Bacteroidota bacterium]
MSSSKIRYGIIGYGRFAENAIAPAIRASQNSELVAIQKRSMEAAKEKAASGKIRLAFDSVQNLVSHPDVDAVFIVSANSAHCSETIAAANAGKHVLVEKPMAMTVAEAQSMIDACRKNKVKLMVGHMVRLSPAVQRIKEIVHSGMIGRVTFVRADFVYDGRNSKRQWLLDRSVAGGGPLFDIGVHCFDTLRFLLNDDVESVKCYLDPAPTSKATEETVNLSLRFKKGVLGSVYCSYAVAIRRTFIEIIGTEGLVSASDFTRSQHTVPLTVITKGNGEEGTKRMEQIIVPDLYCDQVTRFSNSILNNVEPDIPGIIGLENQRILEQALKNAQQ